MSENIIQQVRKTLCDCIDPKSLQSFDRFFKPGEQAKVYGVRMVEVGKIAKEFYKTGINPKFRILTQIQTFGFIALIQETRLDAGTLHLSHSCMVQLHV